MEDELDEIASGDRAWVPTMREFYGPFTETLKQAEVIGQRLMKCMMRAMQVEDQSAGLNTNG